MEKTLHKSIVQLFTGNVIAQLIPILTAPIITRLFSPSVFGEFGNFMAVTSILGSIICLKYNDAIVLVRYRREVRNLVYATFSISIIISIIILIVVSINYLLLNKAKTNVYYFLPVLLIIRSVILISEGINLRDKRFDLLSKALVISAFVNRGIVISLALLGFLGLKTFIIGLFAGEFFRSFFLRVKTRFPFRLSNYRLFNKEYFRNLSEYRKFPRLSAPAALINTLNEALPLWLISANFGLEYAGNFVLVRTLLSRPLNVISTAISQPLYQRFAELDKDKSEVRGLLMKLLLPVSIVSIVLFGGILVFSKYALVIVFGEMWQSSKTIVEIMVLFYLVKFIINSFGSFNTVFGAQKYTLFIQIAYMLSAFISLGMFSSQSFSMSLWFYSLLNVAFGLMIFIISLRVVLRAE